MKRVIRDRHLTPEEAAKYNKIREQVKEELPELVARYHERLSMKEYYLIHIFGSTDPEIVSEALSSYEELLAAAKAWDHAEQDGIFYLVIEEGKKPRVCAFTSSELEE